MFLLSFLSKKYQINIILYCMHCVRMFVSFGILGLFFIFLNGCWRDWRVGSNRIYHANTKNSAHIAAPTYEVGYTALKWEVGTKSHPSARSYLQLKAVGKWSGPEYSNHIPNQAACSGIVGQHKTGSMVLGFCFLFFFFICWGMCFLCLFCVVLVSFCFFKREDMNLGKEEDIWEELWEGKEYDQNLLHNNVFNEF